jgi:alkylation response protein AidB-like acyl-CoA dehydrogenase
MGPTPDPETFEPVAAATRLGPTIEAAASEIEAERRLPAALVSEMVGAGLFHMFLPRSAGGLETDTGEALMALEEVAAHDGSAGWCVLIANQCTFFSGFLEDEDARKIWADGNIVAGTARPIGRAVAVESPEAGFVVSGRWPFASGSSHADWFAAECVVYDGEARRKDEQGNDVTRMTFVPRSEVTVHDTWFTTGLRGTASNDFSIEGAFVPRSLGFQVIVDKPRHPWPFFQAPPLMFATHGAHALGLGRAAIAAGIETAAVKTGWGSDRPMREHPRMQTAVAEATVDVESARTYLYSTVSQLWEAVNKGDPDPTLLRARVRLATSHAVTASLRSVDLLHRTLATSSIFESHRLERVFRDVRTASAHVMVGPLTYESAGRVEMGLEPTFPFF